MLIRMHCLSGHSLDIMSKCAHGWAGCMDRSDLMVVRIRRDKVSCFLKAVTRTTMLCNFDLFGARVCEKVRLAQNNRTQKLRCLKD